VVDLRHGHRSNAADNNVWHSELIPEPWAAHPDNRRSRVGLVSARQRRRTPFGGFVVPVAQSLLTDAEERPTIFHDSDQLLAQPQVDHSMIQRIQHLRLAARVQAGQTMAEYAVVLAVITLVVVGAITALSGGIKADLTKVTNIL
jgi:Flp pilus assembly pilin Flp